MQNTSHLSSQNIPDLARYYELEKLVSLQEKTITELEQQNNSLVSQLEMTNHNLALLRRAIYGMKSEKVSHDLPVQFDLVFDEAEACSDEQSGLDIEKEGDVEISPKKRGRKKLPEDLPRKTITHDIAQCDKQCRCGSELTLIGEEVSEQLDYIPARLQVIEHKRLKYACKSCEETILRAPVPVKPLPKANATADFLSHVIVSKFEDHLPLYRQSAMLERHGIDVSRATLCNWILACGRVLEPLVAAMQRDIVTSDYVCSDETTLNVLDSDKSKSYMWVHMSGSRNKRAVVFDYHATRSGHCAESFLEGFKGFHQCDAYAGYNELHRREDVHYVACWSHARRNFFEITKATETPGLSDQIVVLVQKLYAIEREATHRQLTPGKIKKLRLKKAVPILSKIKHLLESHKGKSLPKSPLGKAIAYALNNWDGLTLYITDGNLRIDNNDCERVIRPFAIGRKNWLFAASTRGAKASEALYSIIATCKANNINSYDYLRHVLTAVKSATGDEQINTLLPYNVDKSVF